MNRAESLNQYIADVNAGIDTVAAWRSHKARVGELAAYEAKLSRAAEIKKWHDEAGRRYAAGRAQ